MFIILGSPRSGTTLLSSVLDAHSDIAVPDETDFIIPLAFIFDRVKDPAAGKGLIKKMIVSTERYPKSLEEFLSEEEILNILDKTEYKLDEVLKAIYGALAAKSGKKIGGDKSPNDLMYAYILEKAGLFESDIKIIHIIRDIRDVIDSLMELRWVPGIENFFPRVWSDSNLMIHNLLKNQKDKYIFLKFEDMVANPQPIFKEITGFLEVPFQEEMLDNSRRGERYVEMGHHAKLQKPFLADEIGLWKKKMDKDVVNLCNKQAAEALESFGYGF